jgi:hypothetical protein
VIFPDLSGCASGSDIHVTNPVIPVILFFERESVDNREARNAFYQAIRGWLTRDLWTNSLLVPD